MIENIRNNLLQVKQKIAKAARRNYQNPEVITLVAVSKTKPVSLIKEAILAGHYQFGENYVQEGIKKIQYFREVKTEKPLIWHFIGPLQSNKSKLVAKYYDWIHVVDRVKIARQLSAHRPPTLSPLNVLIQINISNEINKSGIPPCNLFELAESIRLLPHLKLRGLMAIPAIMHNHKKQLKTFKKMVNLYTRLKKQHPDIDTLSMGMSDDMNIAILAGSTMVRIGTAIFGKRIPSVE